MADHRFHLIPHDLPRQFNQSRRLFLTADQHYGHTKILTYQADTRGQFKGINDMDDSLIANHNSIVRPDDHVIHIGDICFGTWKTLTGILRRLNGTHYLMDGSHDRALAEYINLDSDERPQDLIPKVRLLPKLFEFTYQGEKIVLCHYAMATWWSSHHGSYHFHGHSHGKFPHPGRAIDVGVDSPQITNPLHPILIDEAMKIVDKKKPKGEPHKKTP